MSQIALNLPNPLAARESLFLSTDGAPFTTSRAVAERFGKQHKNVIQSIENLITNCPDSEFSQLNFQPAEYLDAQKKPRIEYRLTHDGFAFLAMRFTGKEAMAWQIAFLQAFNALEAELRTKEARFAKALDHVRPTLRPIVEGTEQGQSRADIAAPLGKSVNSVTYHRRKARELGLLPTHH
ncbi:Rha family transcriptional regulator [Neptuniibacter marinus]|uniref:Rha family transcriptional regulator n=1 Tax=Neptuniibacter marinus TaxID=1806670 RepID=UPI003B5C79F4